MQRPLDTQHSVGETLGDLRSTIYLSPSLENIDSVISILNSNCESPNVLVGQLEKSLSWSATVADESVSSRFVAASALTRSVCTGYSVLLLMILIHIRSDPRDPALRCATAQFASESASPHINMCCLFQFGFAHLLSLTLKFG